MLRLQYARQLLEKATGLDLNVTDICMMSGFGNPSHFSTAFRRAFDAQYIDFAGAACATGQNAAGPCTSQDLSGKSTQYAPKFTGSIGVEYERPVGSGDYVVRGGGSIFARSKFNTGAYGDPRMDQKGFAQVDAHLDFAAADGAWKMMLFGRNLTDKRYLDFALPPPGQSTAVVGNYAKGRQLGFQLGFAIR